MRTAHNHWRPRRAWGSLAVCLAALTLLIGCPNGTRTSGSSLTTTGGSLLRLAQRAEPTTLDPALVEDGWTIELMMQVFEGLVQWSTDNTLIPALATEWSVSEDGRTYTFKIREGVKFHNGQKLTAEDFVFSINRCLRPALKSSIARTYLGDLVGAADVMDGKAETCAGVEAPDPYTLKLTIREPQAYFLAKLTYPTYYAVCRQAVGGIDVRIEHDDGFVGTGPFRLKEWRPATSILLEANQDYWDGPPKLGQVVRRIVIDPGSRHAMFETGELDIVDVSMADYRADVKDPKLAPLMRTFKRPAVFYLALNQDAFPPFRDKRVRQAFAHATDRQAVVDTVFLGLPQPAQGYVPNGVPGHDPNFKGLENDPERARRLLADAGYPGGRGFPPVELFVRASSPDLRRTCAVVAEDLNKNLGIKVAIRELEWGVFLAQRNQGKMPFYFLRWSADYLDPQNFLSLMLHSQAQENTLGYSNPEFDRLCDQADVLRDQEERFKLYRQAEAIAVDDCPWIPLYFQVDIELWNPRLRGVEDCLMGHLPHKRTYFATE